MKNRIIHRFIAFSVTVGFTIFYLASCGSSSAGLSITYPNKRTLFPKDIAAPVFKWDDNNPSSKKWIVSIECDGKLIVKKTEVKEKLWKPGKDEWALIVVSGIEKEQTFIVERDVEGKKIEASVNFIISKDPVEASIFFRSVPLPFKFARENLKTIKWHLGDIGSDLKPHVLMEDIPVCANCHSFSKNGKTIAMDVDAIDDKGAYVMSSFSERTSFAKDSIISWGSFQDHKFTYGLLSQISPDGRYVVSTLHDCEIFVDRKDLEYSQLFFPFKGILVVYDRIEKKYFDLEGANDTMFVQSNPCWTPDGKNILFVKAKAKHFEESGIHNGSNPQIQDYDHYKKFEKTYLDRDSLIKFDIYTIPFNNGKGGKAKPIQGASNNGLSNYFPKVSPDGKWLVFCQAESFMLLQKDSKLVIIPVSGGKPRILDCNSNNMNSWHSWSPNSKWLVYSSKAGGPYTQLYLTHINDDGIDSPPVWLENFSFDQTANNIPEFVNMKYNYKMKIEPDFLTGNDFLIRQGEISLKKGDKNKAFEAFDNAIKKYKDNADAYYNRGKLYYERNQLEKALIDINKALELGKKTNYFVARAAIFLSQGNLEKAMKDLTEALKLDPDDNKANSYFGIANIQLGNIDLGIKHLEKAVKIFPGDYYSWYMLGMAYHSKNMIKEAEKAFSKGIEVCPDDKFAAQLLSLRGTLFASRQNFKAALADFDQAIKLSPNNPIPYCEKGKVLLESGKQEEGIASLKKAEKLGSKQASEILKSMNY